MPYALYNRLTHGYVEDENQFQPRPPRLYASVEAANRKIVELRRCQNRQFKSKHRWSGSPTKPFNPADWEIHELHLVHKRTMNILDK